MCELTNNNSVFPPLRGWLANKIAAEGKTEENLSCAVYFYERGLQNRKSKMCNIYRVLQAAGCLLRYQGITIKTEFFEESGHLCISEKNAYFLLKFLNECVKISKYNSFFIKSEVKTNNILITMGCCTKILNSDYVNVKWSIGRTNNAALLVPFSKGLTADSLQNYLADSFSFVNLAFINH